MTDGSGESGRGDGRLKAILTQLHDELEKAESPDEETRARLEDLSGHVRALLDEGASPSPEEHLSFGERLKEELAALESDHPALAYTIGQVIETLSGLGI